jgi:hypothetical protein
MSIRYVFFIVASVLLSLFPSPANASAVFLPIDSPVAMREFAELFALPMMNSHAELSLHSIVLALTPADAVAGNDVQPVLRELSNRCRINLDDRQPQDQPLLVALCNWPASDDSGHFFALQPSLRPPSPAASSVFAVFGSSVKQIREGLTWLMRHALLHSVSATVGWVASPASPQPWTALRSTQLARSMVTMPMPKLQQ